MLIGPSYEWLARRQVATFVAHVGSGPRRFGALIGEILARWLVAEPIDSLRGDAEAKLAAPVAHRRPYFIPLMGLQSALSAAILGMPVAPPLRAAASALDAAQADAKAPHERSTIAGWGVAISTWLGDAELRTRWTRERAALPPQQSEAETAILALGGEHEIASGMLVARPALATMLAAAALEMGDHHQVLIATALFASGANAASLARERAWVDADLWPSDPYRPRAKFMPAVWSVHGQELHATVEVTGEGGPIRAVAPFMQPLYLLAERLDAFSRGEPEPGDVPGMHSKADVQALLANPEAKIEIRYRCSDPALLDRKSIASYQVVIDTISNWMTIRHGDGFRAQLVLTMA